MTDNYIVKIEKIVRHLNNSFTELMKIDLERMGVSDINSIQSYIIYHLGIEKVTVTDLISRGYYLGTNSSYNVKNMVKNGYLSQEVDIDDTRCVNVQLTKKGIKLYHKLKESFDNYHKTFEKVLEDKSILYSDFHNSLMCLYNSLEQMQRRGLPF